MADIADHLLDLSTQLIQGLNTRTFAQVALKLMVPDFGGYHAMDNTPLSATNRNEVIALMEEFLDLNPDFHTDILDMSVDMESTGRAAKVWIRRTDAGLAEGPRRETLMQLSWTLRDGKWLCDGYQGVRSFPHYGGVEEIGGGGLAGSFDCA